MTFSNESEAVLALISLVMSADQVGSMTEKKYLFDRVGHQKPFNDLGHDEFSHLMARVNDQLFSESDSYDRLMKPEGISAFCTAFKSAMPEHKIKSAFRMACEMAVADGLEGTELGLIKALGAGLQIPEEDTIL